MAGNILSGLTYNNYAVLIAHINGEESFQLKSGIDSFTASCDEVSRGCYAYFNELENNLNILNGCNVQNRVDKISSEYDNFLFNPLCYITFGDTDNLAIVAMDDFDLATRLTSKLDISIRSTCLAFSPKLASIGINDKSIFCEMSDICNSPRPRNIPVEQVQSPHHTYLSPSHLMVATYYKFNAMAVLGPGLLMQEAALKAMAKKIQNTIKDLEANADVELLEDLKTFKCMFLDPQGWSDVATVMFCRNYSVIATVLGEIRTLTLEKIYGENTSLRKYIKEFGMHEQFCNYSTKWISQIRDPNFKAATLLEKNHLFCSTFTTAGLSREAFKENDRNGAQKYYRGDVIANTNIVECPGHLSDVVGIVHKKCGRTPANRQQSQVCYMVGQYDYVYQQLAKDYKDRFPLVSLFDFIQEVKEARDCSDTKVLLKPHIHECCSTIGIPLLKDNFAKTEDGHVSMRIVLHDVRKKLFEGKDSYFSLIRLRGCLRTLQIPVPLSTAIYYLYVDYARYLSDPYLFESVIDLYDIMTASYELITKTLPEELKKQDNVQTLRPRLCDEDYESLVELAQLLHDALFYRSQATYKEAQRGGFTVDVRGTGFGRLLSAADAPLKCGLGLLRRVMNGETDVYELSDKSRSKKQIDAKNRRNIGGASKVSINVKSLSHHIDIGNKPEVFIASVDLNFSHLVRPRGFYIHFHETAHLICDFLRNINKCPQPEYECKKKNGYCHRHPNEVHSDFEKEYVRARYEDVFSDMLMHNFIFGQDHTTFLRNYMANYSLDSASFLTNDDREAFCRMLEVMLRGFFVTEPYRCPDIYNKAVEPSEDNINLAYSRFSKAMSDAGCFFYDYERLWNGIYSQSIEAYFKKNYKESFWPICCMWNDVKKIYNGCVGKHPEEKDIGKMADTDKDSLLGMIKEGLEKGKPLIRILYTDGRTNKDPEDRHVDAFFLIGHVLGMHIAEIYGNADVSKEVVLLERELNGKPILNRLFGKEKFGKYLIDRNYNDLFVVDPQARAQYMRSRIAVIKTLWDVSTNFRARRTKDMLTACG